MISQPPLKTVRDFQIRQLLEQQGNVNLFKFVINPHDFAQSVENIFHLSFLIRDGECALDVEDGEPMICMLHVPLLH